jgi:DNA repair exonuclease SbcCD nuclease subunit
MSKLIICSDLHLHKNRQFASRVDWIDVGINTLNQVIEYSKLHDNLPICILGDIFQLKDRVQNEVLNALYDCITKASEYITFLVLVGNHDGVITSESSLKILNRFKNIWVFDKPDKNQFANDVYTYWIPYQQDEQKFIEIVTHLSKTTRRDGKNLLFIHQEINSSINEIGYTFKNSLKKELFLQFDYVFCGHIHKNQVIRNIVFTGAMHHTSFKDCGNDNSFIEYDSETNTYKRIPIQAPKFMIEKWPIKKDLDVSGNLLKVTTKKDEDRNSIRRSLYDAGGLGVVFEDMQEGLDRKIRLEMKPEDNYISVFEKHVKQSNYTNKDLLGNLGVKILKEVSAKEI